MDKPKKSKKSRKVASKDADSASDESGLDDKPLKKSKKSKKKKASKKDADAGSDDGDLGEGERKPRIRISVKENGLDGADGQAKKRKKGSKRKRALDSEDAAVDGDIDSTPVPKKRKKGTSGKARKPEADVDKTGDSDPVPVLAKKTERPPAVENMFNVNALKRQKEQLDGSFASARRHLVQNGPWKLPDDIRDEFKSVALATLFKMDRHDRYSVFADSVSEEEAPGYDEVVENPMDFGTMKQKINDGTYAGTPSPAAAFYEDFLLVFDNCNLYNPEDSEVAEEAARVLGLLPEAFASSCAAVSKRK